MTDADAAELVVLGYNAYVIYHQIEPATQAWRKAASSGHADLAPRAAWNLGALLEDQGDAQGAKEAYQQAVDSGHADVAPRAAR